MKKYARYYKECMGVDYNGKKTYREGVVVESGGEQKLLDIEKLEDEMGIDLVTLFKALNSCWFLQISTKKIYGDIRPTLIFLNGWHLKPNLTELPMLYALKDCGKTWALTKEELERKE